MHHYASFHHQHSDQNETPLKDKQNNMRSHLKFSFGVGNYFKFSFSLGRPRDASPKERDDTKKELAEFDKTMAKVRL